MVKQKLFITMLALLLASAVTLKAYQVEILDDVQHGKYPSGISKITYVIEGSHLVRDVLCDATHYATINVPDGKKITIECLNEKHVVEGTVLVRISQDGQKIKWYFDFHN